MLGTKTSPLALLFVCAGNICRSPLAEGVMKELVHRRGLEQHFDIESCGIGAWHAGEQAHLESRRTAQRHGLSIEAHRARQLRRGDFERFDLLLAMDKENAADLKLRARSRAEEEKIRLLREYDPLGPGGEVPDPYYGPPEGFEEVYQIVARSCAVLLDKLSGR